MLPNAILRGLLLFSLSLTFVSAQSNQQQLQLNSAVFFNASTLPNPSLFSIPKAENLVVSVALCATDTNTPIPRFFVSEDPNAQFSDGQLNGNAVEINLKQGTGSWLGLFPNGGVVGVSGSSQVEFEIGLSTSEDAMHQVLTDLPYFGDSTSNQALIFSPPLGPQIPDELSYPNYTLPQANLSFPAAPTPFPIFSIIIRPTASSGDLSSGYQTGCRLMAEGAKSVGNSIKETPWLKDPNGWRNQWIWGGLEPQTNYTTYVVQDGVKISGPLYFVTKSASFPCHLVSSLPYCPSVSWAVPLPAPDLPNTTYDSTNLPTNVSDPILENVTNFTTSLLTFACGRDMYSPLVTCGDCQQAYRSWLCLISFTRCGEPSDQTQNQNQNQAPAQVPLTAALAAQSPSSAPRNPNLRPLSTGYTALLPCLEACNLVDRVCPSFLKFRCPVARFNANNSYGVGYIDKLAPTTGDGSLGEGLTGVSQDQWGNVWCNW